MCHHRWIRRDGESWNYRFLQSHQDSHGRCRQVKFSVIWQKFVCSSSITKLLAFWISVFLCYWQQLRRLFWRIHRRKNHPVECQIWVIWAVRSSREQRAIRTATVLRARSFFERHGRVSKKLWIVNENVVPGKEPRTKVWLYLWAFILVFNTQLVELTNFDQFCSHFLENSVPKVCGTLDEMVMNFGEFCSQSSSPSHCSSHFCCSSHPSSYLVRLPFLAFSPKGTHIADAFFNVSALLSNFTVPSSTEFPVIKEFFLTIAIGNVERLLQTGWRNKWMP